MKKVLLSLIFVPVIAFGMNVVEGLRQRFEEIGQLPIQQRVPQYHMFANDAQQELQNVNDVGHQQELRILIEDARRRANVRRRLVFPVAPVEDDLAGEFGQMNIDG
ncbi:MAG: hypothetical protein WD055_01100 [Candidatus Dependentiae bacterium]